MDGLGFCSLGVVDASHLDNKGAAMQTSFSIAEVRANNPDWEKPEPRPKFKYEKSRNIVNSAPAERLKEFSMSKKQSGFSDKSLSDAIKQYFFSAGTSNHLICIHSSQNPECFYSKTILFFLARNRKMSKKIYPRALVVTENSRRSSQILSTMTDHKKVTRFHGEIENLDDISGRNPNAELVVSTAKNAVEHINSFVLNEAELKASLKFIIVHDADKLLRNSEFDAHVKAIFDKLKHSDTKFIFMLKHQAGLTSKAIQFCFNLTGRRLFIEVEKQRIEELFTRLELRLVVSSEEIANREAARRIQNGTEMPESLISSIKMAVTPNFQKMTECTKIIQVLREERQRANSHSLNSKKRKERILIVAKNEHFAINVMMFLRMRVSSREPRFRYKVDRILESDSDEAVEKRNFQFRHGDLDVLVIDWRSLHAVQRGTVDTVIFFDGPEERYFQTILETEMSNLIAMSAVKLKLYILLEETSDLRCMPLYVELLKKYKKTAPQWFQSLYEKYVSDRNRRREIYRADRAFEQDNERVVENTL